MWNRRSFLQTLSSLSAAALAAPAVQAAKSDHLGDWLPTRTLGHSGEEVTMLAMGGYHFGAHDEKTSEAIVEAAIEGGVRFFDNAKQYQNGGAEDRMGKFLSAKYRDDVFIMTKSEQKTADGARKELEDSLRRLKTDRLDLWQIHALDSPDDVDERLDNGVLDVFLKAKEEGKTRHIGFTGHHDFKAHLHMLERTKDMGELFTTAQMPINILDPSYASFIEHVVPQLVERKIAPLAMKTLVFGNLVNKDAAGGRLVPDKVSLQEALHFVWSLPVAVLITGAESVAQMKEKIALAKSFKPLDDAQRTAIIAKVAAFAGTEFETYKA